MTIHVGSMYNVRLKLKSDRREIDIKLILPIIALIKYVFT